MQKLFMQEEAGTLKFTNESGQLQYQMSEAKTLPTRQKFILSDAAGKEIGEIIKTRNTFGLFNLPHYRIHTADNQEIILKKEMRELKEEYQIEGEGLSIKGDWLSGNFSIYKGSTSISTVSEFQSKPKKDFQIAVIDSSNEKLIVCFMAGIHLVFQNERI